ncbi:DUF3105 domain-containing protein [Nocardioides bizhenqiangii]|uniref:DUF3105 domain-containing protein n=1 Tax=Nocardioides bizhenqiangii TaxID=3095076 RepID=A0ABZ0ZNX2_9ACTN|nr:MULTISPECIES: DUF3105 domain-containing protein [unclassified Nocardioides]MDZ5621212.1 DUF3105 domain-containing protein [Nocardioides sp. HM23]WQQ25469.1 DUF3105 domain-containing protein [Nocardioides sp. HM61]
MAKTTKTEKSDRQKVIDDIRRKQRSAEKRQGFMILAVCIVIALVIIVLAAFNPIRSWIEQQRNADDPLAEIGGPASVCGDVTTKNAEGSNDHRPTGEQIEYDEAPVAFGPHWNEGGGVAPVGIDDRFFTDDSRPELEALVHNLEHGFTILWYDETAADDATMLGEIKAIAEKLDYSDTNNRLSFIAAPWTSDDGGDFPDGQHIAFTHWSADEATGKSHGVWQYCSEPSGEALETFMKDYPYYDAPEPVGGYLGEQ